jgi:dethiobiotin synthetase
LADIPEPLELLTPVALRLPLAPAVAAAQENRSVDLDRVAGAIEELAQRYDVFVIEGAGGLFVPLVGTKFLVIDMVRWLRLPLLVVARAGLGTINHTALTVIGAHQAGLPVAGVVLNRYPDKPSLAEATNPQVIAAITEVPVLGLVPEIPDLEDPSGKEKFLAVMDRVCHELAQACAARAFLECLILK